jgi:hypothetical protein
MKLLPSAISVLTGLLMAAGYGQQVRVSVQYVELPHTLVTDLLASAETDGARLHDKAFALTKEGEAKILETCLIVCRSGEKATAESIREEIYPTEVTPPGLPCGDLGGLSPGDPSPMRQRTYTAFDTRDTGTTLEVEATVLPNGRSVRLRLAPEMVSRNRLETIAEYRDKRGDASIRMPIYETWRTNTSLTVRSGRFSLLSVIHPKPRQPAPFQDSRILLFVRADVLDGP